MEKDKQLLKDLEQISRIIGHLQRIQKKQVKAKYNCIESTKHLELAQKYLRAIIMGKDVKEAIKSITNVGEPLSGNDSFS